VLGAITWVGGAALIQVFGILTKRAADPAKSAFFASSVSFAVLRVFLPAALVVIVSGIGLTVNGNWDWGEPFIAVGLVLWAVVALIAFGFLGRAIGAAGARRRRPEPCARAAHAQPRLALPRAARGTGRDRLLHDGQARDVTAQDGCRRSRLSRSE
jgi:uncharacterized membrane protein